MLSIWNGLISIVGLLVMKGLSLGEEENLKDRLFRYLYLSCNYLPIKINILYGLHPVYSSYYEKSIYFYKCVLLSFSPPSITQYNLEEFVCFYAVFMSW